MRYIFAQVMGQQPPIPDPWDTTITVDALGKYFFLYQEYIAEILKKLRGKCHQFYFTLNETSK